MVEASETPNPAVSPTRAAAPKPPRHTDHFHTNRGVAHLTWTAATPAPTVSERWQLTDRDPSRRSDN